MEIIMNEYGRLTGIGTALSFLIGIFILVGSICIAGILDRLLSNKIRSKDIDMKEKTRLKALEVLKSNVELKLNLNDIKELFK